MTVTQQQLVAAFPTLDWKLDFALSPIAYFKLGGAAELYLEVADLDVLQKVNQFCRQQGIPSRVIGGMSNVVVADAGVAGVLIRLTNNEFMLGEQNELGTLVTVGAGIKMATLVAKTVDQGLTGLEFFLGVPGMLGGAVFNNAHYLSDLISAHIERVQVIDLESNLKWLSLEECDFGYDHSRFQSTKEIIVAVEFRLKSGNPATSKELITRAIKYRAETQPLGMPSSGCIFQNVPNSDALKQRFPQFADKSYVPGGFLIDQAGLKNTRVGALEVSDKHAAFIVNHGGGTAKELLQLINLIKEKVQTLFAVELHEEVFFIS